MARRFWPPEIDRRHICFPLHGGSDIPFCASWWGRHSCLPSRSTRLRAGGKLAEMLRPKRGAARSGPGWTKTCSLTISRTGRANFHAERRTAPAQTAHSAVAAGFYCSFPERATKCDWALQTHRRRRFSNRPNRRCNDPRPADSVPIPPRAVHSFAPPAVSPLTRNRWHSRNMTVIGTPAITAVAAKAPQR